MRIPGKQKPQTFVVSKNQEWSNHQQEIIHLLNKMSPFCFYIMAGISVFCYSQHGKWMQDLNILKQRTLNILTAAKSKLWQWGWGLTMYVQPWLSCFFKAEHNPITAKLGWGGYLVPFLVLDNNPEYKHLRSTHLLADPRADWAIVSNRWGNNIKRKSVHLSLQWNTVSFPQVN